jgi:predicted CXXCH cytochrome family protein
MFEHAPVEESCLNCHNPHGSRSVKLLNEKVPNLCQDCHDAAQHPGRCTTPTELRAPSGHQRPEHAIHRAQLHELPQRDPRQQLPGRRGRRFIR